MGLKSNGSWRVVSILLAFLSLLLFLLFLTAYYALVPMIARSMITDQSKLIEGSRTMNKWSNPAFKMRFKVWTFSVKNPDEILKGAIPEVAKTGPYVFEKKMKNTVLQAGNGTVTFKRKSTYHFLEEESCQTCILGNRIWIPNIIYQKFVEVASQPAMKAAVTTLLAQTPFLELQVGDLLFHGYKDPFLENFCDVPFVNVICETVFDLPERIGLFFGMNDTEAEGEYVIMDGTHNIMERGNMLAWNGMPHLRENWWSTDEARRLRGSEGSIFHPFITKEDELWTFSSQLCRSVRLVFEKELFYRDIPVYRFVLPPDELDTSLPENNGFCNYNEKLFFTSQNSSDKFCYPKGLLTISQCQRGVPPVVVSMPNFNYAADEVKNQVKGMDAINPDLDRIYVDVEPNLGTPLRASRHIQLNVEFWKGNDIVLPAHHLTQKSSIIPLIQVEDEAEVDEETYNTIKAELIDRLSLGYSACFFLLFLSIALLVLAIAYALYKSGFVGKYVPSLAPSPSTNSLRPHKLKSTVSSSGSTFPSKAASAPAFPSNYI